MRNLSAVCSEFFGQPRQCGGSHAVFRTPWPGDPRVNIQDDKGKAKAYQVRQVLSAIDKLDETKAPDEDEPTDPDKLEDPVEK